MNWYINLVRIDVYYRRGLNGIVQHNTQHICFSYVNIMIIRIIEIFAYLARDLLL